MANPTVKTGIPGYANLAAALWVSDQIDQAGTPSKGAWDALTGTFYPAYNSAAFSAVQVGTSSRNALRSSAAVCGIELNNAFDLTTGVYNELGGELTIVALVRRPATSASRSYIIQNTQKFTPTVRGGYQMYMTATATATGNEYTSGGPTSVAKTTGYPANEWMLMVYKRGADGVAKLYRNDVSNHDTDAARIGNRVLGDNGFERRPALFNWAQSSGVNAVPLDIAAVLILRDGDITVSDIQNWGGTSSANVLVDPAAVLNAVFDFADGDTTPPTLSGPTGTSTGSTTATLTVTTNEGDGSIYRLVDTNATATQAAVLTANITSVLGGGPGLQTINVTGLTPATTYYAHLVHKDGAGNNSAVVHTSAFTTDSGADTTAPTLTSPTGVSTGPNTANVSVTTNEGNGTLYKLTSVNATELAATVKATGTTHSIISTGAQPFSLTGLTPATLYYTHFVHRDAAGNDSTVSRTAAFTTSSVATSGTVDILDWVNNTGTVHANATPVNISFHNTASRALVHFANPALVNASGDISISHANFVAGTTYSWLAESPSNPTWFAAGRVTAT